MSLSSINVFVEKLKVDTSEMISVEYVWRTQAANNYVFKQLTNTRVTTSVTTTCPLFIASFFLFLSRPNRTQFTKVIYIKGVEGVHAGSQGHLFIIILFIPINSY